jgi:hypothetical protein
MASGGRRKGRGSPEYKYAVEAMGRPYSLCWLGCVQAVERRLWPHQHPMRQFETVLAPEVLSKLEERVPDFDQLYFEMDEKEVADRIRNPHGAKVSSQEKGAASEGEGNKHWWFQASRRTKATRKLNVGHLRNRLANGSMNEVWLPMVQDDVLWSE